jgi:hypothetical protein
VVKDSSQSFFKRPKDSVNLIFEKQGFLTPLLHSPKYEITICLIKRKENSFFFLSNMKFCFMKRLFYTTLEETMSVAQPHLGKRESLLIGLRKSSPAVDGATAAQTLGQCNKPIERPITCVSAFYDARQAS